MCTKCLSFNKCIGCSKLILLKDSYSNPKLCRDCGTIAHCYNKKCTNTWSSLKSSLTDMDLCLECQNTFHLCRECGIVYPMNAVVVSPKIRIRYSDMPHCAMCISIKPNSLKVDGMCITYHDTVIRRAMCVRWRAMLPGFDAYIKRLEKRRPISPELVGPLVEHYVWILRGNDDAMNTQYKAIINVMLSLSKDKLTKLLNKVSKKNNLFSLILNVSRMSKDVFWLILSYL